MPCLSLFPTPTSQLNKLKPCLVTNPVYLDNPFSTPSTTGAVGLPAWTPCVGFEQVCCTSWPWCYHSFWTTLNQIHRSTDCPSPSGLIINTFLHLSFDEFCSATVVPPYWQPHHPLIHGPPPHTLAFYAHHTAMSGHTTERPKFS